MHFFNKTSLSQLEWDKWWFGESLVCAERREKGGERADQIRRDLEEREVGGKAMRKACNKLSHNIWKRPRKTVIVKKCLI